MPKYPSVFAPNQLDKPVIVLGMHRSGTRLLSRCLHDSGVFMGMMQEHNSEAVQFLSLNDRALVEAGADWIDAIELPRGCFARLNPLDLYREHFKISLASSLWIRLKANYRWGWKDPRNTFALGAWLELFRGAHAVHLFRDGRAVAMSLWRRHLAEPEQSRDLRLADPVSCFRVWERYLEQVEVWERRSVKMTHVSYERLVAGEGWADLEKALNIPLLRPEIQSEARGEFPSELDEAALLSPVYQRWKLRGSWS